MAGDNDKPVIVKKVTVVAGGHHGGAWKVAYADFVTAMMAFFLLLWLLNVTTDEQKRGIADYFAPTVVSQSTSGAGGILGGQTMSIDGARLSEKSEPAVVVELTPPRASETEHGEGEGHKQEDPGKLSEEQLQRQMAEHEQKEFEKAERQIRQAIQQSPELAELSKNLIIDNTPEGLRIQLVDQDRNSMFPTGGAEPLVKTRKLLQKVAEVVQHVPNQVAISGHTDATPFRNKNGYGNWELSADRANASRRTLVEFGVDPARIASVSGKADTQPLIPDDPTNASNRRIAIVLLRQTPLPAKSASAAEAAPAEEPKAGPAPHDAMIRPEQIRNSGG